MGKNIVLKGLTNKAIFNQWSRQYKLAAGAKDERFDPLLTWAEVHDANAPAVDHTGSGITGAPNLPQHLYASLS